MKQEKFYVTDNQIGIRLYEFDTERDAFDFVMHRLHRIHPKLTGCYIMHGDFYSDVFMWDDKQHEMLRDLKTADYLFDWNADIRRMKTRGKAKEYYNKILMFTYDIQSQMSPDNFSLFMDYICDTIALHTNEIIADAIGGEDISDEDFDKALERVNNPGRALHNAYIEITTDDYSELLDD